MMTTLLLYSLKSAFALSLLYIPYILVLRRETFFRFNRMVLLSILSCSLVLPLLNVSQFSLDRQPVVHAMQQQMIEFGIPIVTAFDIDGEPQRQATADTSISWFALLSILYVAGALLVLFFRLAQIVRMGWIIRGGSLWHHDEEGCHIYCHVGKVAPFSWMRNIVISEDDYGSHGREILLHEKGHIRNLHSLDILLLTLVEMLQWWNPLVYMLGLSLRDIHEYEADDYVLRQGISAHAYQMLIIKKAVGTSSYTFANNFNHSLTKKRITMMLQNKSNPWMRSKVLYVIPMAVVALSAFATPKFVTPIQEAVKNLEDKGSHFAPVNQTDREKKATDAPKPVEEADVQHIKLDIDGTPSSFDDQKLKTVLQHVDEKDITYIVDGEERPLQEVNKLQAADITHLSVLYDAASRAIYGPDAKSTVIVIETKDGEIVDKPEILPEFKGGPGEMYGWLARNIKYPAKAQENGTQGRMMVQFVVEKDGSVSDVKAVQLDKEKAQDGKSLRAVVVAAYSKDRSQFSSDEEYQKSQEALREGVDALITESERVVKLMSGQWEPGYTTKNGEKKAVRTRFTLPIMFRLN